MKLIWEFWAIIIKRNHHKAVFVTNNVTPLFVDKNFVFWFVFAYLKILNEVFLGVMFGMGLANRSTDLGNFVLELDLK